MAAGYHVVHDTRFANEYRLIKERRPPLIFKANRDGTYSMPVAEFKDHFPLSYRTDCHSTDVDRSQVVFTKNQRARASLYRAHHASCLGHAHDDRVIAALENGTRLQMSPTQRPTSATPWSSTVPASIAPRPKGRSIARQSTTLTSPLRQENT